MSAAHSLQAVVGRAYRRWGFLADDSVVRCESPIRRSPGRRSLLGAPLAVAAASSTHLSGAHRESGFSGLVPENRVPMEDPRETAFARRLIVGGQQATLAALVLLAACTTAAPGPSANASARAHTELAAAYYQSAQYATAAAEARAALASDPAYACAHNLHGLVLMATGQLDAAQAAFDRAVGLDPQDADARNNRAVLLCRTGRVDEALRDWEAAARTPYYATPEQSSRNAAACLIAAGRRDEAQSLLERAARQPDLTAAGRAANVTSTRSDTANRDAP